MLNKILLKTIHILLVFSYLNVKSQISNRIQIKIEHKLNTLRQATNIITCLKIAKSQQLNQMLDHIPLGFPLHVSEQKFTMTSLYGYRFHPISKKYKMHKGIDIAAKIGAYIIATADGRVTKISNSDTGYGKKITIKHKNNFSSNYAHLSKILVKKGQQIRKGMVVGLMGSTGRSTGSHLHYEIIKNGIKIDPKEFLIFRY